MGLVEPVVDDGRAFLQHNVAVNWHTLDEAGAERLISQVDAWYDALNGGPTPEPSGRQVKPELR